MSISLIKSIREKTGLSFKDIKKAVEESSSDSEEVIIDQLRKQGALKAAKRQDKQTNEGGIFTYVHDGRIGAMLELRCETDFVARGDDFKNLGRDLTLHIAAMQPKFVSADAMDQDFITKELEIAKEQLLNEGKPENIIEKILEGKKAKISEEYTLLGQSFFKESKKSVQQIIDEVSAACGEKLEVTKFITYTL